eukprot:CAMPEP_0194204952 /NCGR_PEP_ID=MMETSP0156-20130528/4340_1 /TAXON_ID=33649 /ORGANISM="Thalassionema nitzschioides, Strain L26-B" /LENGTH=523 /DNA_ID=CAMNT_0038931099 /DNA_START=92 /DNA_END=1663 /DNA_ORIENTATION=+
MKKDTTKNVDRRRAYNIRKGSCNSNNTESTVESLLSSSTIDSNDCSRRFPWSTSLIPPIDQLLDKQQELSRKQEIEELKSTHAKEMNELEYKLKQREDSIASLEGALKIQQMTMEGMQSEVQSLTKQLVDANFKIREIQKETKQEHKHRESSTLEATPLSENMRSKSYHTRSKIFTSYESRRKSSSHHDRRNTSVGSYSKASIKQLTSNREEKSYTRSSSNHERTFNSPSSTSTAKDNDGDKQRYRRARSYHERATHSPQSEPLLKSYSSSMHHRDEIMSSIMEDRSARRCARRSKSTRNCKSLHARSNNDEQPNHGEDLLARRGKTHSEPRRRSSDLSVPLHSLISDFHTETNSRNAEQHKSSSARQKKSIAQSSLKQNPSKTFKPMRRRSSTASAASSTTGLYEVASSDGQQQHDSSSPYSFPETNESLSYDSNYGGLHPPPDSNQNIASNEAGDNDECLLNMSYKKRQQRMRSKNKLLLQKEQEERLKVEEEETINSEDSEKQVSFRRRNSLINSYNESI